MPNNDIFSDPDFLALSDEDKSDVLAQIKAKTGTMPTPSVPAEENPNLGKLPGTNVPVAQTARDAAKIATTTVAGEGIGPLFGKLRSGLAPAGVRGSADLQEMPGGAMRKAPTEAPVEPNYARNQQLNRAALMRGGQAAGGGGPATGSTGRLGRLGAPGSLSSQPAVPGEPAAPAPSPRLVKLPGEIAAEAQRGRAFETATQDIKPAARLQGMRNAGKGAPEYAPVQPGEPSGLHDILNDPNSSAAEKADAQFKLDNFRSISQPRSNLGLGHP